MRVANVIPSGEIGLYESDDGGIRLDVRLEQETFGLPKPRWPSCSVVSVRLSPSTSATCLRKGSDQLGAILGNIEQTFGGEPLLMRQMRIHRAAATSGEAERR